MLYVSVAPPLALPLPLPFPPTIPISHTNGLSLSLEADLEAVLASLRPSCGEARVHALWPLVLTGQAHASPLWKTLKRLGHTIKLKEKQGSVRWQCSAQRLRLCLLSHRAFGRLSTPT